MEADKETIAVDICLNYHRRQHQTASLLTRIWSSCKHLFILEIRQRINGDVVIARRINVYWSRESGNTDDPSMSNATNDDSRNLSSSNKIKSKNHSVGLVKVVLVRKENAKRVKTTLEGAALLDKRFRMVPSSASSSSSSGGGPDGLIAVPVVEEFDHIDCCFPGIDDAMIEAVDHQLCPYSTKMLGSRRQVVETSSGKAIQDLSLVQLVILDMVPPSSLSDVGASSTPLSDEFVEKVIDLDSIVCPRQLEIFGDDRTIIIPPGAFEREDFVELLKTKSRLYSSIGTDEPTLDVLKDFWSRLASAHKSARIVRKGGIDPNSKIRESGSSLVWPCQGIPESSGPASPSWIRVTEQGIKQSFDMTRVMFSRGNISEKIRFGKSLVQKGDIILDAYAGIGYYTLPALVHGHASFVYACEWNEHAANALRYNVADNHVEDRVEILEGDCRDTVTQHNIVDMVDRVSLGLLPSSEGGWRIAVRALKNASGGWLHVHGNVPVKEMDVWAVWLCSRLSSLATEEGKPGTWVILCSHVERVKSFAPTIAHYVADVFMGPPERHPRGLEARSSTTRAGMITSKGNFVQSPTDCEPPSCALSPEGVLSQAWMR